MSRPHCPNPDKMAFATLRRAAEVAFEKTTTHEVPTRPYRCECGDYHLTTKGMNGNELTIDMIRALCAAVA